MEMFASKLIDLNLAWLEGVIRNPSVSESVVARGCSGSVLSLGTESPPSHSVTVTRMHHSGLLGATL